MVTKTTQEKLIIGIPKGSLEDSTLDLFARAGYHITVRPRSYVLAFDDERISGRMFRAQEMSRYVASGVLDCGLTGYDWIQENNSDVVEVSELVYAKQNFTPVRWVLAVPDESPVRKVEDLEGGIVATELVNVSRRFFEQRGVKVQVEFSYGATEAKARLLDGIVDLTETGSSLRENGLRIVETIMTSSTRFIANRSSMQIPWKRQKIENLAMLLQGAIDAYTKVGLKMNVPRANLQAVEALLPAAKSPTVSPLADPDWVALEVIVEERVERDLAPQLKRAGATGIITYPLNKVIL
jgi:ATP phosphoribosyltransferase